MLQTREDNKELKACMHKYMSKKHAMTSNFEAVILKRVLFRFLFHHAQ